MLIFYAHFPIPSFPTHHHRLHARGVFSSFFSLLHHHPEFNNNQVKARETRKSIKFSFSSPSIAFLCFFLLVCCLFIISLVGLLDCITFFLDVCTFVLLSVFFLLSGSATATIRSGSLTFNHSPHSTKSKDVKKKIKNG